MKTETVVINLVVVGEVIEINAILEKTKDIQDQEGQAADLTRREKVIQRDIRTKQVVLVKQLQNQILVHN